MNEPVWLDVALVRAFHSEQLAIHGGASGIRSEDMLLSALARPRNKWSYGENSLTVLAAAYAYGLAKNHPFVDGNKRATFLSIIVFLGLNGLDFDAAEAEAAVFIEQLAAGVVSEEELAAWIARNSPNK